MNDLVKTNRKIENLKLAVSEFKSYCATKDPSNVEKAGTIQGFEFCFELFWKFFKTYGEIKGYPVDSPRTALSVAAKINLIADDGLWLLMLKDRNETSHIYNRIVADLIHERVVNKYQIEFLNVLAKIEAINWQSV